MSPALAASASTTSRTMTNAPPTSSPEPSPKLMATQNFEYAIRSHMVSTPTGCDGSQGCYVWVTPEGNLTFSKDYPNRLSYVSFLNNRSVSYSTFGVRESTFLMPLSSKVSITSTTYDVNSTESADGVVKGYLNILYNFTTVPFKATATYKSVGSAASFNIFWLVSGGRYVVDPATNSTREIDSVTGNSTIGIRSAVYLTASATSYHSYTVVDVRDSGGATFVYGKINFDNAIYSAVAALFPANQNRIDPSFYQWAESTCSSSCSSHSASVSIYPVQSFYMLIVTVVSDDTTSLTVSDNRGTVWNTAVQTYETSGCDSSSGSCQADIFWGIAVNDNGVTDTVTVSEGSSTVALRVEVWEFTGVDALGNTAQCLPTCSSTSYPSTSVLMATGRDVSSSGSGFTFYQYASSSVAGSEDEIPSSASSTTFPFSSSVNDVESGAVFINDGYISYPCPKDIYLCFQLSASSSNSNSLTVTSGSGTACSSTTASPCFSVQLNYFTNNNPLYWQQIVLGIFPIDGSHTNGYVIANEEDWLWGSGNPYSDDNFNSSFLSSGSVHWYQDGYVVAVYSNGTGFLGIRDPISGVSAHAKWHDFNSNHGSPTTGQFEGAVVGNAGASTASFSSGFYNDRVMWSSSFPNPTACSHGVWYWGNSTAYPGKPPTTAEQSNIC